MLADISNSSTPRRSKSIHSSQKIKFQLFQCISMLNKNKMTIRRIFAPKWIQTRTNSKQEGKKVTLTAIQQK